MVTVQARDIRIWMAHLVPALLAACCLVLPALAAEPASEIVRTVFPGAEQTEPVSGTPPAMTVLRGGAPVGWVFFSHETVNSTGFSGKPIDVLVGLDSEGMITGARIVEHHEPILAIGISEQRLAGFTAQYRGRDVRHPARLGHGAGEVDGISGASISSLVLNDAIMRSAREVARAHGLLGGVPAGAVDFDHYAKANWASLLADGSIARRRIDEAALAEALRGSALLTGDPNALFIELYTALLTPAWIGRNLLGDAGYVRLMSRLPQGGAALLIAANGRYSFKGTAFARGGLFDRVQIVQGSRTIPLRAEEHERLEALAAEGVPELREIGVFVLPAETGFDAAQPWRVELLVTGPDQRSATFALNWRMPATYLRAAAANAPASLPEPGPMTGSLARAAPADTAEIPLWRQAWKGAGVAVGILGLMLAALTVILFAQDAIARRRRLHRRLRGAMLAVTLLWLGWWAGAQLSVLNVLTFVNALLSGFRWDFFLLDPLLFGLWSFVALALMFWGRGVFCGWLCPFGALQELLGWAAQWARLPRWRVPFALHERLWTAKYIVFAGLLALSLQSLETAQPWTEAEPFKTVIVLRFARAWPFVLYALLLLLAGLFVERAFCRYLCPLGGALALPARLRMFEWLKRRRQCGSECHICAVRCPVQAIHPDGHINVHECIHCLACQVNYHDVSVCPPLIEQRKRREARATAHGPAT